MKTRRRIALCALLMMLVSVGQGEARTALSNPAARGDQLLFFYDATDGRVSFLLVSNLASAPLTVEVEWYPQDLSRVIASRASTIAGAGNVILDPSQVPGVSGQMGLAIVTPIRGEDDRTPVVPRPFLDDGGAREALRPLYGASTIADIATGSGLALSPIGRSAVVRRGAPARAGQVVDGDVVRYQTFPEVGLLLPAYFDPSGPDLTSRMTVALFEDRYGPGGFGIAPVSTDAEVRFRDAQGAARENGRFSISGLHSDTLEGFAGSSVTGSGSAFLTLEEPPAGAFNFVGFSAQSLGTFSVGGVLQGVGGGVGEAGFPEEFNLADGGSVLSRDLGPSGPGVDVQVGQTFTVKRATVVTQIAVAVSNSGANAPLTLDIRRIPSGALPVADDRTVVQSLSLPPSAVASSDLGRPGSWPTFDLGPNGLVVAAGDRVAFTLRTRDETGAYGVFGEAGDGYPDGISIARNVEDAMTWEEQSGEDMPFLVYLRR